MRCAPHDGQNPRRLQLKATSLSCPQSPQCRRKEPWDKMPHSRNVSNPSLTNCGRQALAADSVCSKQVAAGCCTKRYSSKRCNGWRRRRLQHLKHCPGLHARHCSARAAAPAAPAATALGDSGRRFVATGLRRSAGVCRLPPIDSALKPAMHLDPLPCRPHHPARRLPAPDAPASLRGPLVVALLATLSALALVLAPGPASGGAALAQLPQQQVGGWRPSGLLQTQQTPGHQRPQCPA